MSTWTEVTGIIRCDWVSFNSMDSEPEEYTKDFTERRNLIQKLFDKNSAPKGSEDTYIRGTIVKGDINTITILASLRDFDDDNIKQKVIPWWNNIIDNLSHIRQAVMTCTTSRETYIFEKRITSDFDLYPEDCPLWSPDPGIVVCTDRQVKKLDI